MEFNQYPSQYYDYNVNGNSSSLHWCSRWSYSMPHTQISTISDQLIAIEENLTRVIAQVETARSSYSHLSELMYSISNHIHELISEESSLEHSPSVSDCLEHFDENVESDLEDELLNCMDKVFDESSQRNVTKSFASILATELSLVSSTVSHGNNFSSRSTQNLHHLPHPKVAIAFSSSDVELAYKLFDTMSDRELFVNFNGPLTTIISFPHIFGSHNCTWVDTGQASDSSFLDEKLFYGFNVTLGVSPYTWVRVSRKLFVEMPNREIFEASQAVHSSGGATGENAAVVSYDIGPECSHQRMLLDLSFDPGSKWLTMLVDFATLVPYNIFDEDIVTEHHILCNFWPRKSVVRKYAVAYAGHTLCFNVEGTSWVGNSRHDINNREHLTAIWPPRPLPKPPFSTLLLGSFDHVVPSVRLKIRLNRWYDSLIKTCTCFWFSVKNSQSRIQKHYTKSFHGPLHCVQFDMLPLVPLEYETERNVQLVQLLYILTEPAPRFLYFSIAWLNDKSHWSLMLWSLAARVIIFLIDSTWQILEQDKLLKHKIELAGLFLWFLFPHKMSSASLYHCVKYVLLLSEERVETVVIENEIIFLVIFMACSRKGWIESDACLLEAMDIHSDTHPNLVHYVVMVDCWTGCLDKARVITTNIKHSFQESKQVLEYLKHPSKLVVATAFPLLVAVYKPYAAQTWCKLIGIVGKIEGLFISFAGTHPSSDHILGANECLHKAPFAAAHIEQLTNMELKIYLFRFCYLFGRALAAVYSKMEQRANGFTGTIAQCCFTKPFGIFLLCTDSKCSCFEELVSILELMMVMHSYIQYQDNGFLILNYGQLLEHLKRRIIFKQTSQLSGFSLNGLQAGTICELEVLRIDRQLQYSSMSFHKNDMVKKVEPYFSKKHTIFDPGKMLCKVKGNIFLEWHKKVTVIERDYFGSSTERDSTCRDVIKSREQLMLLFPVLLILQGFEAYVGVLLLEAGFINFTDDGQEFTLSLEETRKIYFINEGSIFHYDQMVADGALRHPWNALEPSDVVVDVLIVKHEVAEFIIHRQLMKHGITVVPTDFGISLTTILQNQKKTFVGYQVIDSNLEDKVLFDDGRNVMNVFKIEDPLRRMANYIWDPGRMTYI